MKEVKTFFSFNVLHFNDWVKTAAVDATRLPQKTGKAIKLITIAGKSAEIEGKGIDTTMLIENAALHFYAHRI